MGEPRLANLRLEDALGDARTRYLAATEKSRAGFEAACAYMPGGNTRTGRTYRMMNEVPTLLLIVIVVSVIARPF